MPDDAPSPEVHEGLIPTTPMRYRLSRVRLADLPIGALFTRRPPHQFLKELSGTTGYDVVTGLVLRGCRALDPMMGELTSRRRRGKGAPDRASA